MAKRNRTDPLDQLNEVALHARRETAPHVDVSARVTSALRAREASIEKPLVIYAALAATAAAITVLFSISVYQNLTDPLVSVFQMAQAINF